MKSLCRNNIICVSCPKGCRISIESNDDGIENIYGNDCLAGREYVLEEFKNPSRVLPTTIRVKNAVLPLVPVKTSKAIPKKIIFKAMREIAKVELEAPISIGDIIIKDFMQSGVNLIATRTIPSK